MTIGSLFAGVGGVELGLEWAGLGPVLWQVERDRYCRSILARHWPAARRYTYVEHAAAGGLAPVDIICGGFPCQDLSSANPNGAGLAGRRSGLWFAMLDCIEAYRPGVVVVENVSRLVRRGLDTVVTGLCDLGYEVEATRIRAADVGAPHRRERLFVVAYAGRIGKQRRRGSGGMGGAAGAARVEGVQRQWHGRTAGDSGSPAVADAHGRRCEEQRQPVPVEQQGALGHEPMRRDGAGVAQRDARCDRLQGRTTPGPARGADTRPTQPGLGRAPHGLSGRLDRAAWPAPRGADPHPWEPPRTVAAGLTARRQRLRALGNAVVPHCAYVVGMRIQQRLAELHQIEEPARSSAP